MAFTIDKGEPKGSGMVADRRLFVTADKARVVEDGSPDAAYLLAPQGGEILAADAERLGLELVDGRVMQGGGALSLPTPESPADEPQTETPEGARRGRKRR